ncbi:class I SAM-dependent methyltransferase [Aneurinibacillus sp. Ricciae_BoGa-3]|uniref:class I SAM-dependent methyltransferase n=1 Tax=Aneurinibacillus sp. Ricciae_BoGa-3 TaxID=3022697 RepID=UPI0023414FD7|nr:class I SAM-dependent methyltransferase [Aneurinibacillus sp. Ricciae_BoGa-3]WCK54822.1 class I SAM-dependent methyltransferase [Aneurinibacillus sp. Ricciae_BoGa-3]
MGTWFTRFYDIFMEPLERRGLRDIRRKLIRNASGTVLEIGSGTGNNFPYYEQVEKVVAIEPELFMRERSLKRVSTVQIPIEVISAGAEALPFPDNTFDTVVGTLVLCTIANPSKALSEIRRVCKPDGTVLFFEHVRLNNNPFLGRLQDCLTPIWRRLCHGCHLNRDSLQQVTMAGFKVLRVERYFKDIFIAVEAVNKKI